jgi:aspartate/tyrosine/aromatic aminotransferase
MSFFDSIELFPEDPILGIPKLFAADPRPHKVNLGIGSYKDTEGKDYILDCVRDAEAAINQKEFSKEYLPIEGYRKLLDLTENLIYGNVLKETANGLFFAQTIGGTSALSIGGQLIAKNINDTLYLPNATWPNHKSVFSKSGFNIRHYPYYDHQTHQMDFHKLCQAIEEMPQNSTILLHACCQNPTGIDPTNDQWKELSALILKQKIIPFFDFAYQGFKKSLDDDAFPIRYFASQGHELFVANSFAKNLGLYGERVGTLSVVTQNKEKAKIVGSHIKQLIRGNYSSPPRRGAEIITEILSTEELKKTWIDELENMRIRLVQMRHTLISGLQTKGPHRDWSYMNNQSGFFSFIGLTEEQVHRMIKDHAIYMPQNGRINVAGLNGHNMDYVIDAIVEVTQT